MTEAVHRIFLLSPAKLTGQRAKMLLREGADFDLARRVRAREGAEVGEVFSFVSGLYFRGKLAYARAFARPPAGVEGIWVITPSAGLVSAGERIGHVRLRRFSTVAIDAENARYRAPLMRDARALSKVASGAPEIVLLGSIATGKYVDLLLEVFGERLHFPQEFVGRGDMSRGGLMLRSADERRELTYVPLAGAVRHGARPPKLAPRVRST